MFRAAPVRLQVPATSANLGPAFDAAGLALSLVDDVYAQVADSGLDVDVAGEGAEDVRRDERHLVVKSMRAAFKEMGGQPRGLVLRCLNRIPHGRGLGSSAAAIVAGILAARELTVGGADRLPDEAVLELATSIEGHPDNVAACISGGFTLAWTEGGRPYVLRLDVNRAIIPVVLVPSTAVSTKKARGLLPETVPHRDAAASAGRAALLTAAMTTTPALLLSATEDRLHQSYRAPAMPRSASLVEKLRAEGIAAVISGAGPTVLTLTDAETADRVVAMAPKGWVGHRLTVEPRGAAVMPLDVRSG